MYKAVWQSTRDKLMKIAVQYNSENGTTYGFKQVLKQVSEPELIALAGRAGITLELDKDYRKLGKVCTYNEMLEYNAEVLYAVNADGEYANLRDYLRE